MNPPRRGSMRLKGYDYSWGGAYFVTLCIHGRELSLGEAVGDKVRLNPAGRMIENAWGELPSAYPGVEIDEYVIMPNHLHGIVVLVEPELRGTGAEEATPALTLGDIIKRFKTLTMKRYGDGVEQEGWPRYAGRLWQRNYYEHIIRNENALTQIRRYIGENPERWAWDKLNPEAVTPDPETPWIA